MTTLKRRTTVRPVIQPIGPSIAYVTLTQEQYALIDTEDIDRIGRYNWCARKARIPGAFYVARKSADAPTQYMHRVLLSVPIGFVVDHINGNTLDNRRSNLRAATVSQNTCNSRIYRSNSSGYKGVSWSSGAGAWQVHIQAEGKRQCIGYFGTPEEAHANYRSAAAVLYGEFANFGGSI